MTRADTVGAPGRAGPAADRGDDEVERRVRARPARSGWPGRCGCRAIWRRRARRPRSFAARGCAPAISARSTTTFLVAARADRGGRSSAAARRSTPRQVESELGALASVAEAAVVGAPAPRVFQERVVACVVERARPRRSTPPEPAPTSRERVADYAVPDEFVARRRAAAQRERQARPGPACGAGTGGGRCRMTRRTGAIAREAAAPSCSSTKGYESTTLREIAEALGIKRGEHLLPLPEQGADPVRADRLGDGACSPTASDRPSRTHEHAGRPLARPSSCTTSSLTPCARIEATLGETELRSLTGERRDLPSADARRVRATRRSACSRRASPAGAFAAARSQAEAYAVISHVHERRHLVPGRRPADAVRGSRASTRTRHAARGSRAGRAARSSTACSPSAVAASHDPRKENDGTANARGVRGEPAPAVTGGLRPRRAVIENVVDHPLFASTIACWGSWVFRAAHDPESRETMVASPDLNGEECHVFWHMATNPDDLLQNLRAARLLSERSPLSGYASIGRDELQALLIVDARRRPRRGHDYHARVVDYVKRFQREQLMTAAAVTDVKGDRGKRPADQDDPDLYLHVVDRRATASSCAARRRTRRARWSRTSSCHPDAGDARGRQRLRGLVRDPGRHAGSEARLPRLQRREPATSSRRRSRAMTT